MKVIIRSSYLKSKKWLYSKERKNYEGGGPSMGGLWLLLLFLELFSGTIALVGVINLLFTKGKEKPRVQNVLKP
jgi:hypothetical protein